MKICDECDTVAHCTKHGCIPKVSAKDAMYLALEALEIGKRYARTLMMNQEPFDAAINALAEQPAQHECRCNQGQVCHVCDPIEQPAQQEPVSFLANGTRFKMSFFDCAEPEGDEHGESDVGTYVTCFEAFAKELDGRWVALVAAEDDCHLKLTSPQAQRTFVELTDDEFYAVIRPFYGTDESCHAAMRISLDEYKAIEAKLKEKNT